MQKQTRPQNVSKQTRPQNVYICPIDENVIYMTDKVKNIGSKESPLEILYHCNFGYPLLSEKSEVTIPSSGVTPRNDHAKEGIESCCAMEKPQADYEEKCYYHALSGKTCVSVFNPDIGKKASIKFDTAELGCFTEWKMMGVHEYVLGLEPGNCLPDGRDVMREKGILDTVKPGEEKVYHLVFEFCEGK